MTKRYVLLLSLAQLLGYALMAPRPGLFFGLLLFMGPWVVYVLVQAFASVRRAFEDYNDFMNL